MGYTDITIYGSDIAEDNFAETIEALKKKGIGAAIKILNKALKEDYGGFNTSGPENVGMILTESTISSILALDEKFDTLVESTIEALDKKIKSDKKADWEDQANRDWHLKRYRQILKNLKKLQKNLSELDEYEREEELVTVL